MAQKAQHKYDYVAHVSTDKGTTVELSGSKLAETVNNVYQYLLQRANEIGGFLTHQIISEAGVGEQQTKALVVRTSQEPETPKTFGAKGIFEQFESTYSGASRLKFKETGK